MNRKTFLPMNLQFFGEQDPPADPIPPAPEPDKGEPEPKPEDKPSLLQMTQEELTRKMAKEKGEGKRSVFSQLGIKDDTELTTLLEKLNAIKEAEAKAEADKPEIERLKGELAVKAKIEADYKATLEKLALLELNELIREKGVTDPKELKLAKYEIRELMAAGKDVAEAAEEYFTANPVEQKSDAPPKPQIMPGTQPAPVATAMTKEDFNKLTYPQKLEFKLKNPEKFAEFTKK